MTDDRTSHDGDRTAGSTTGAGAPAPSGRNSLTIGPEGPILLHDVHVLELMAHFNREKVIERQPHAKGSGAFGIFKTTGDMSAYAKAAPFQKGVVTNMPARFSTVAGEQDSATRAASRSNSIPMMAIARWASEAWRACPRARAGPGIPILEEYRRGCRQPDRGEGAYRRCTAAGRRHGRSLRIGPAARLVQPRLVQQRREGSPTIAP